MKFLRRSLCALCVFTLLLGCFSLTANAQTVGIGEVRLNAEAWIDLRGVGTQSVTGITYTGETESFNKQLDVSDFGERFLTVHWKYTFSYNDTSVPLFLGGKTYTFNALGLHGTWVAIPEGGGELLERSVYYSLVELGRCYLTYTDGSTETINGHINYDTLNKTASFRVYPTPAKNVRSISFEVYTKNPVGFESAPLTSFLEVGAEKLKVEITTEETDDTDGFLDRLITKLQAFRQNVVDSFNTLNNNDLSIFEKVSLIFDTLVSIPQKMWSYFKIGLQGLFIPDEEFMQEWVENNRQWCIETFGALFQSFDLIVNSYRDIDASAETHIIEMPLVTIPLPDNKSFTFGGYEVKIVPEDFEFLATMCKSVVGIVCSFAFINGMRRRYDDIMEETK